MKDLTVYKGNIISIPIILPIALAVCFSQLLGCATTEDTIATSAALSGLGAASSMNPGADPRAIAAIGAAAQGFGAAAQHQSNIEAAQAGRSEVNVNVYATTSTQTNAAPNNTSWMNGLPFNGCSFTCNSCRLVSGLINAKAVPTGAKSIFASGEPITFVHTRRLYKQHEVVIRNVSGAVVDHMSGSTSGDAGTFSWNSWLIRGEFVALIYLDGNLYSACRFTVI